MLASGIELRFWQLYIDPSGFTVIAVQPAQQMILLAD
jgi:hypothetical protein